MPSSPFGEHLRREREMRGVSLEEISAATRISPRFLEALETAQWDRLPGGAFNRGFIRSVARFLGLDEESMVAEYALETKGGNQSAATPEPHAQGMPRDWRPVIAAVVGLVVLIFAGVFAFRYFRAKARARAEQQQSQSVPATMATPVPVTPAQPAAVVEPSSQGGSH
jgi:cytoskeleton protein RodZ